jgi:hypothetical protein
VTADNPEFILGHAARELDRLIKQAAFFGDLTVHTLKLAGLGPGRLTATSNQAA